jgi:YD repeat-containing protein
LAKQHPINSISAWTYANGSQQQRSYNQDGQLISQTLGASQRKLAYDSVGNITAIIGTQNTLKLSYDAADRLIAANDQQW